MSFISPFRLSKTLSMRVLHHLPLIVSFSSLEIVANLDFTLSFIFCLRFIIYQIHVHLFYPFLKQTVQSAATLS
uniref:Uncharacterized protein n=1 Tax=Gossypium raimondii TaxID=29730 RepID=A0A0D2RCN2_GOSRA|nr:hypothetical protein B456_005G107700 [Gossypium raimondii]